MTASLLAGLFYSLLDRYILISIPLSIPSLFSSFRCHAITLTIQLDCMEPLLAPQRVEIQAVKWLFVHKTDKKSECTECLTYNETYVSSLPVSFPIYLSFRPCLPSFSCLYSWNPARGSEERRMLQRFQAELVLESWDYQKVKFYNVFERHWQCQL